MKNDIECLVSRIDVRTVEEADTNFKKYSKLENYYIKLYSKKLRNKNKNVCNVKVMNYGNTDDGLFIDLSKVKKAYNVDFILDVSLKDGSRILQPIEVGCSATKRPWYWHIKRAKLIINFNKPFANVNKPIHLMVIGTDFPEKVEYTTLNQEFLKKMKERKLLYPRCFGGVKPAYRFYYYECNWRQFNSL